MKIDKIIEEAKDAADKYNLHFVEIDRTEDIISLRLLIDNEIFIQIYGNIEKNKLNLVLVFKKRRLYGYDSEGGKYHCHPLDNPDRHIFVDKRKSIHEFVQESMKFLEESNLL
ncbi:hypothetical protein KKE26_02575 [bacterium]|nr:hypothetical protein [bacterium]MBU1753671.1 hypothetical protein [bacterium]